MEESFVASAIIGEHCLAIIQSYDDHDDDNRISDTDDKDSSSTNPKWSIIHSVPSATDVINGVGDRSNDSNRRHSCYYNWTSWRRT